MSIKIHIRRAEHYDIDELVAVCRECFPDSLKHNAFAPIARRRWTHFIRSPFIETYLALVDGNIAGFYVLITDMAGRNKEKQNIGILDKLTLNLGPLSGLVMKPYLIGKAISKAIKSASGSSISDHQPRNGVPKESSIDKIAWGEIRATSPGYQKMGVARELNRFVLDRCRELKKEILGGNVDEKNLAVRSFLDSMGYVETGRIRDRIIYKKKL